MSAQMVKKFTELVQEAATTSLELQRLSQSGLTGLEIEAHFAQQLDSLADRLFDAAHSIVAAPTTTIDDLTAKAFVVLEYAEDRSSDIVHKAAITLARGLLTLTEALPNFRQG